MTILTIPSGLKVREQPAGQKRFDLNFASGDSGVGQSRLLAPPRWMFSLVAPEGLSSADAAAWRALIIGLDGRINQLATYDLLNTAPLGTATTGSWTCNGGAAVGATSLPISCGVGNALKTILTGTWLGVNQAATNYTRQLLHVQADLTLDASGNGTLSVKPALRGAVAAASTIVYDKPTCLMRQTTDQSTWTSVRARQSGFSLDLMESWEA